MIEQQYRPENIKTVLTRAMIALSKTSDSPRADAQLLLAHALGKTKEWLIARPETFIPKANFDRFTSLLEQRMSGIPVAYVIGSWWFFGKEFEMSPDVLVPRPETELLVEEALRYLRERTDPHAYVKALFTVLDIGVGSGAIACSIASECASAVVEGTDSSQAAITLATRNARRLNVQGRCKFHLGDLGAPVSGKTYDCIIANLPYVPTAEVPRKPNPVGHEPPGALDGGADGLALYRRLVPELPSLLRSDALVLLEAAPGNVGELQTLACNTFPGAEIRIHPDYAGLERFVAIRVSQKRP